MNAQVGRWGNSLAVRIPGANARELGLDEGSELELTRMDGGLLLRPRQRDINSRSCSSSRSRRRASMAKRTGGPPSGGRRGDDRHIPDAGELIWLRKTRNARSKERSLVYGVLVFIL